MQPYETPASPEASTVEVEIPQGDAITVAEALALSEAVAYRLGKSTLQRWAKHWANLGTSSPVKCVLVTNRLGVAYRISRSDLEAWVSEQATNTRPPEAPQDLVRLHETQRDLLRPREASQDPERHRETSRGEVVEERLRNLEEENMQLKIDLGVRKELLSRAREEMQMIQSRTDGLLRENGALQYQLAQLPAPNAGRLMEMFAIDEVNEDSATPADGQGRPFVDTTPEQPEARV